MKLKIYSFGAKIREDKSNSERFECHCFKYLIDFLKNKGYDVDWFNLSGDDKFIYKNDCEVLINQGSITIFEFENKTFKVWDCGDHPNLTLQLCKSKNFIGASIGQYNKKLWDDNVVDKNLRKTIVPGIHFEQFWQFGNNNYQDIQEYRKNIKLDNRLLWRGSLYENYPNINEFGGRKYMSILNEKLNKDFMFGYYPIHFDDYIKESISFKLILCSGVGGGYCCGDYCFRDAEMYGLGIPTIRPKYAINTYIPLIPDYHYISIEPEFDERFKYKNHETLADKIIKRYNEVINDDNYLNYISNNARQWYMDVLSYPSVINNIVNPLNL